MLAKILHVMEFEPVTLRVERTLPPAPLGARVTVAFELTAYYQLIIEATIILTTFLIWKSTLLKRIGG